VRRAGASGELTMRADSGFWSAKAHVIAADTSDRDGAVGLLGRLDRRRFPRLRHGRADQGYRGPFLGHVRQTFKITLEVVGVPMVGGGVAGCRLGPSRRWCLPLR
jgi:hypothetical protein